MFGVLDWIAANPLRVSGGVAGLAGTGVTLAGAGAWDGTAVTTTALTLDGLVSFSATHPAYPVAALLGLLAFVFYEG
ncbi:hypothetical protein [Natronomonas sp. EA1]|uniref:hypothetical protein n=1 Tax=Natronomonas sp. EA1 TaxID=3421655 RepID=UPI003EB81E87